MSQVQVIEEHVTGQQNQQHNENDSKKRSRHRKGCVKVVSKRLGRVPEYRYSRKFKSGKNEGKTIHHDLSKLRRHRQHFYNEHKKGTVGLLISRPRVKREMKNNNEKA